MRMCVDYRKLNGLTRKDRTPLPGIDELLDSLYGAHYFSTLVQHFSKKSRSSDAAAVLEVDFPPNNQHHGHLSASARRREYFLKQRPCGGTMLRRSAPLSCQELQFGVCIERARVVDNFGDIMPA
jgi:hypothetical protein